MELDYRPVQSVNLNAEGQLEQVGGTLAVFELMDLGKGLIGFRDIANDRWLAYPEKKKSSSWASLYTYPEDYIKNGLHRTFLIKESDSDYVNHIDGDKTNDNVANLEYVSPSSNSKHASITGLHTYQGKLSYEQKVEIAFLHKCGLAYTTIHKNNDYGVSKSAIQRICNEYEKYTDSVEFELADACIRLLDLAGLRNIDLDSFDYEISDTEDYSELSFTESIFRICIYITDSLYKDELPILLNEIFAFCKDRGVDIFWHIDQNMKYNELRPYKHGNKNY